MKGYHVELEHETLENENFRKVLFTAEHMQLVLMTLQAGEEIGMETHDTHDQFIRVEEGEGKAIIGDDEFALKDGSAVVIPAGNVHNILNTGEGTLKLYTLYAPPEHPDGTVHKDKAEADAYEAEHHHGK
jgi:mannose-6-phosphate isomerase-like protein (cupin superfamily)